MDEQIGAEGYVAMLHCDNGFWLFIPLSKLR